jgi:hypothetical protein
MEVQPQLLQKEQATRQKNTVNSLKEKHSPSVCAHFISIKTKQQATKTPLFLSFFPFLI